MLVEQTIFTAPAPAPAPYPPAAIAAFSYMVRLATLPFYQSGTKAQMTPDGIDFIEPGVTGYLQGLMRKAHGDSREDLTFLKKAILLSALQYEPYLHRKESPIRHIFAMAQKAIVCFYRTYEEASGPQDLVLECLANDILLINRVCQYPVEELFNGKKPENIPPKTWTDEEIKSIDDLFKQCIKEFIKDSEDSEVEGDVYIDLRWQKADENQIILKSFGLPNGRIIKVQQPKFDDEYSLRNEEKVDVIEDEAVPFKATPPSTSFPPNKRQQLNCMFSFIAAKMLWEQNPKNIQKLIDKDKIQVLKK